MGVWYTKPALVMKRVRKKYLPHAAVKVGAFFHFADGLEYIGLGTGLKVFMMLYTKCIPAAR